MALKTLSISSGKISSQEYNRLDSKYYHINHFFDALEESNSCDVITINDLDIDISSGSYVDTYVKKSEGIPYIRVANIKPFMLDESESDIVYVSKNVPKKMKTVANAILIGRTQATISKLGTASIIDDNNAGWAISQHVSKIVVDDERVSSDYLVAYLNSKFFKSQMALASHGNTRVELTHSQLKKVRVFLPDSKVIQNVEKNTREIIDCSRKSFFLIEEAKEILRNIFDFKRESVNKVNFSTKMSELIDFEIWNPKFHKPYYIELENTLKKKFKVISLDKVLSVKKGCEPGSENYLTEIEINSGDKPFIRTSDVINNEIDSYPDYFLSSELLKSIKVTEIKSNDIVFSKDGKIAQVAYATIEDNVVIASGLVRLRIKDNSQKDYGLTPEYLFTLLSLKETGYIPAIRRTVIASTIPHFREERLKELQIPLLDKKIVNKVTELIKEAMNLKTKKKQLMKKNKEIIDEYYKET